jgi:hypothetical protein
MPDLEISSALPRPRTIPHPASVASVATRVTLASAETRNRILAPNVHDRDFITNETSAPMQIRRIAQVEVTATGRLCRP